MLVIWESRPCEQGHGEHDVHETLRDSEFRAKVARLQNEMLEKLAPAADGPVVIADRKHRGRLVFDDAID